MNFSLTEPNPGERISVDLIRNIIRAIRSLTPIPGHGMKTSIGPNGTVYDVKADQVTRKPKENDNGCYAIESLSFDEENDEFEITFKNPYYSIGGKTYTGPTELSEDEAPVIVALKAVATGNEQSATLETYDSIEDLNTAEKDSGYYIMPLYKFASDGSVECDFRIGPTSAMGEF